MTPYNLAHGLYKARQADHTTLADPGDAGTIKVSPTDLNVCVVTGGTTRTLQDATEVPLGVVVQVISQTSTITVNSVALADGEFALFRVTLDSNGAHVWTSGLGNGISFATAPVSVTGLSPAADTGLQSLLDALEGLGLIVDNTTDA